MAQIENWGDYFWPGMIDHCRKNLLGERDPDALERQERLLTSLRRAELAHGSGTVDQTFDLAHLKALHHHLFQDVYAWAGQLRVTELVRPSEDPSAPPHEFVKPDDLERLAPAVFAQLGDPADLAGQDRDTQVDVLARTYAGLNVLHPFVEGNGRTQRMFLFQAAEAAGLRIDWNQMPHQNQVMAQAFNLGPVGIAEALRPCLTTIDATRTKTLDHVDVDHGGAQAYAAAFPHRATVRSSAARHQRPTYLASQPQQANTHER